ncbi:LacI family DNA-binding transcriptional regulator [Aliikangiella sp. IMCC44359]|uniref:LacI family DNA-binding transcriptional regulator n=1 Tax=Aliikangiella sp. IMCC44359 TaxID=3459125 RepID=UPI00403AB872
MRKKHTGKNITVYDVADKAGVSKSTVSLVLTQSDKVSQTTRTKVLKAMNDIGYVYNRDAASLRSRRSNLVAIVINDLTNPYSAQLAVGLEQHIRNMGMFSILVNSAENSETQTDLVQRLKEYNVAAFIICPAPNTSGNWINHLIEQGFPVINIMRELKNCNAPTVLPDNRKGTRLSTQHLIDQGYKNIAFLGGTKTISDFRERFSGFKSAMKKAHLNVSDCCFESETNRHGGRQAMSQALQKIPNLEAVVCFSDVIAYGAIEQMSKEKKQAGKDIAIVGFDDLQDSQLMSPALSTVHIDAGDIGQKVCEILKAINNNQTVNKKYLVNIEFIPRKSG